MTEPLTQSVRLNKAERETLRDINAAARKAFRSKPTLKILGSLSDRGIISFDPFTATASITEAGHALLQANEVSGYP